MPSDNDDKATPDTSPVAKQTRSFSRQFAMAMELPFVLVGAIIAGGAMGYFLDVWLHTKPVLMFVFGCIGFAAGVRDVLRRLPKE
jgi:ATP synthase protein I